MAFGLFRKRQPEAAAEVVMSSGRSNTATFCGTDHPEPDTAQGHPRVAGTRAGRAYPPARARRDIRSPAAPNRPPPPSRDHPRPHRRAGRPQQRRAIHRHDLCAGRRQLHPFGRGHRRPGARCQPARGRGRRRRPCKPAPMWIACATSSAAISNVVEVDRADCAADNDAGAERDDRGGTRRRCRPRLLRSVATEVKALAVQTQNATEEITEEDRGLAEATPPSSVGCRASHLAPPSTRSARCSPMSTARSPSRTQTTSEIGQNAATASQLHRLGRRQRRRNR